MRYYHHPASPNCRKVTAVIRHLGIDAEHILVDLPKGEQMAPGFLAVNPNGKVPALVDGDRRIWESNAIIIYLADKEGSDLWPDDARRLEVLKWMFWEQSHLMMAAGVPFFQLLIKPMLGEAPDQQRLDEAYSSFGRLAKVLDDHLGSNDLVVGDALSLADFAVAGNLSYAAETRLPLDDRPNIRRWLAALDEIPSWAASAPPRFGR